MVTWDNLHKCLPPGATQAQYHPLAPIKATTVLTLDGKQHRNLKTKRLDWVSIRDFAVEAYDKLGFPYDSTALAVEPLTWIVRNEIETALTFALPGPLRLELPNRCCGEEVCALKRFFECLVNHVCIQLVSRHYHRHL